MDTGDIANYLNKRKSHIGKQSRQIKNFDVFQFDYVPEQPLMRAEVTQLLDDLLRFELSGIPTHYAIIGSRGSGKTLTVKHLQRVVPKEIDIEILYANCREHNTSFKLLAHFLGIQARGTSLSGLFERFCKQYSKKTAVVLDEVDLMSPKDRRREILYLLSRCAQPFMVLALANNPNVLKQLDAATRSSLQPMPLHFRNYNADQIRAILQDRARLGLRKFDEGQINEIAALTTRLTNADARVAIKTMQYVVMNSEQSISDSFEHARRDLVIDLINDLSDSTLQILWAITLTESQLSKEAYDRYTRICTKFCDSPFSYVHFFSQLSYLQSVGLVALSSTKVDRIYTNRIIPTFDRGLVEEVCKLRFLK